jgi:hypothetical protein
MTPKRGNNDDYPPAEAEQRFKTALRAALSMPPIPHAESSRKKPKKVVKKRAKNRPGN